MAECPDGSSESSKAIYKTPVKKTIDEYKRMPVDDDSMKRYRDSLIGFDDNPPFPDNPNNIVLEKYEVLVDGKPDVSLELKGDTNRTGESSITLKEGSKHRLRITYYVQRDIVPGLKYTITGLREGIKVWDESMMLGSYAPRFTAYVWTSPEEEAPTGITARGTYLIRNSLTNDDNTEPVTWEWKLNIKKSDD